ncbi:hypothetical protein L209DRAFT_775055 [Thermothelomyces heterothallicus CBS 203.75]
MSKFLSPWERRKGLRVLLSRDSLQRAAGTESGASTSSTPASRPDHSSSRPHSSSPTAAALDSPFTYGGSYDVDSAQHASLPPYEHRTTSDYPSTSSPVPPPSGFQDHWTSTTPTDGGALDPSTSAHRTPTQPTAPPRSPSPPWWSSLPVYLHPYVSSDTDEPDITGTSTSAAGGATSTATAYDLSTVHGPSHTPPYQTVLASEAYDSFVGGTNYDGSVFAPEAYDSFVQYDDEDGGTNYDGSVFDSAFDSFVHCGDEDGATNYGATNYDGTNYGGTNYEGTNYEGTNYGGSVFDSAFDSFVYCGDQDGATNYGVTNYGGSVFAPEAYDSFVHCEDEDGGTNYGGSTSTTEYRSGPRYGGSGGGGDGGDGSSHGGAAAAAAGGGRGGGWIRISGPGVIPGGSRGRKAGGTKLVIDP